MSSLIIPFLDCAGTSLNEGQKEHKANECGTRLVVAVDSFY